VSSRTRATSRPDFAAAGEPKERWATSDADQAGGLATHPIEYERRVTGFLQRALIGGAAPRR
jgi:hypothetical protein